MVEERKGDYNAVFTADELAWAFTVQGVVAIYPSIDHVHILEPADRGELIGVLTMRQWEIEWLRTKPGHEDGGVATRLVQECIARFGGGLLSCSIVASDGDRLKLEKILGNCGFSSDGAGNWTR